MIAKITQECAAANNITPEQIAELRVTKDKSTIDASDDLKCFAKCAIDQSGFIVPGKGIDVDRLVKIGVSHGKDETLLRSGVEKCKSLYNGSNDCEQSWALYSCFYSR